jgi:hypothetical protein
MSVVAIVTLSLIGFTTLLNLVGAAVPPTSTAGKIVHTALAVLPGDATKIVQVLSTPNT